MTDIQKIKIEQKRLEYQQNLEKYLSFGSPEYCSFSVYGKEGDLSITVISNLIESISDDNIPFTNQVYYNILNDGSLITLNLLMTPLQIAKYVSTLKRIE